MSKKIRHRGPDWSGIYTGGSAILAHERLSIVDPESGRQPLFSPDGKQVLTVNGEIYNHRDLRRRSPAREESGARRRYYRMTPEGEEKLKKDCGTWRETRELLNRLLMEE